MKELRSTTLYFKEGSSDKVYVVNLVEQAPGECMVTYGNGRRGGTLATGKKTMVPVSLPAAQKVYDKLVASKIAGGYTPGESGTPYAFTDKESRSTGLSVQLLNAVEAQEAAELLGNVFFYAQEKFDGKRMVLRKQANVTEAINRKGLTVGLPQTILEEAARCEATSFLLDGEAIGDRLMVFDLLELDGVDFTTEPYHRRLDALYELMMVWQADAVEAVETADSPDKKRAMFKRVQANGGEGVVFKRTDAPYTPGRPASGGNQRKYKFYHTASCLVERVGSVKRSVSLTLLDETMRTGVGNVTIPPNHALPERGQVVEVRYLYAYSGGSLYQPTYLGVRSDLTDADCNLGQLKYKPVSQS